MSSSSMAGSAETPQHPSNTPPSHPAAEISGNSQALNTHGFQNSPNAAQQMFSMMYPVLAPGSVGLQNPEQNNYGAGLYAVPFSSSMGSMAGFPPSTLIPLKYKIPTRTNSAGVVGEEHGQEARQQHGPQRQVVVRRFQFAIHLDLALIIKLAALVILLNQDGSRQKLIIFVFCATLVYLYRTGVLRPLIQWVQQGGAPPRPRPAVQQENAPLVVHGNGNDPRPEENVGAENQNQNQPAETEDQRAVNENQPEAERGNGINLRGIANEIQTIVVGFVTSLLPGFHHND